MARFVDTTWPEIEALRSDVHALSESQTVQLAAHRFAALLRQRFETVVLARLFAVLPYERLPPADQAAALSMTAGAVSLPGATRVLSLLGTSGRRTEWNDRLKSKGHLAIPLIDRAFVQGIPMIAKLLGDLEIDLASLSEGRSIATRKMLGGNNSTFYVEDAVTSVDAEGRFIIPARDFVAENGVRSVFGMGGAWLDGSLAIAICFCTEKLERVIADRFPSLISNFKMATAKHMTANRVY